MREKGSKIQNKILEDENWNLEKNEKKGREKKRIDCFLHSISSLSFNLSFIHSSAPIFMNLGLSLQR